MDFHYELLEETRKEIKNMRFFREVVEINAEEYEMIHDYDKALENAFDREYEEFEGQTWVDILEENMAKVKEIIYQYDNYAELSKVLRNIKIPELNDIEYTIEDYCIYHLNTFIIYNNGAIRILKDELDAAYIKF